MATNAAVAALQAGFGYGTPADFEQYLIYKRTDAVFSVPQNKVKFYW